MTGLDALLGDEYKTPEAKLYLELAREDQQLLALIIEARKARMSQDEVAQRLGVSQASVSAFERLGNDPKLSTIRRYAKAVGVMIRHQVDPDPANCSISHFISHVGDGSVLSTDTAAAKARRLTAAASELVQWPDKSTERVEDAAISAPTVTRS